MAADIASRSSIPAKGILCSNGSRDGSSPNGTTHATASAAVAVAATSGSTITGEFPAHEGTSHHGGTASIGVTHLRDLAASHRASAAVLSLALVTTGNNEHGCTVHDAQCDGTNSETSSGSLL